MRIGDEEAQRRPGDHVEHPAPPVNEACRQQDREHRGSAQHREARADKKRVGRHQSQRHQSAEQPRNVSHSQSEHQQEGHDTDMQPRDHESVIGPGALKCRGRFPVE